VKVDKMSLFSTFQLPATTINQSGGVTGVTPVEAVEAGTIHPIHVLLLMNCAISACTLDIKGLNALRI